MTPQRCVSSSPVGAVTVHHMAMTPGGESGCRELIRTNSQLVGLFFSNVVFLNYSFRVCLFAAPTTTLAPPLAMLLCFTPSTGSQPQIVLSSSQAGLLWGGGGFPSFPSVSCRCRRLGGLSRADTPGSRSRTSRPPKTLARTHSTIPQSVLLGGGGRKIKKESRQL